MKTRLVTLFFAISILLPILCYSEGEWKVYPMFYGNDTLASINTLAPMKDGGILFAPWNALYIIQDDSLNRVANPYQNKDFIRIYKMQPDSKGTIWLNTLGGLAKYTKSEGFQKVSKLDYGSKWDYGPLNGLTVDKNDNVWFLSGTPYLTKFDGENFTDYTIGINELPYFPMFKLTSRDSTIIYDCPKGIVEFTPISQDSSSLKITPLSETKLNGKSTRCMQFDKSGNFYASSDTNDLSIYTGGKWEAINIPDSLKAHNEIWNYKYIKKIVPIKDSQIYIFWAMHDWFCKYDRASDSWEKIDFPKAHVDSLYGNKYTVEVGSAEFDIEGNLWISTAIHGLLRYKPEGTGAPEGGYGAENHALDAWIERIYPNPTRGNVLKARAFLLPDGLDNVTAYVSDILGNKLIEFSDPISINPTTGEANLEYSLEELPNGAYLFVLQKGISIRAKNFVKID
ncbi:MAG: hypothetical protein ACM3U1_01030 [Chloroflexota bacterium]